MALTPQGRAQQRRCWQPCEHWRQCMAEARRRGSKWADFCAHPGLDPAVWLNLTPELWDGPAEGCPAGYWHGLRPVDLEAERAEADERMTEAEARRLAPVIAALEPGVDATTLEQKLGALVSAGLVKPETAARIEEKVLTREAESAQL